MEIKRGTAGSIRPIGKAARQLSLGTLAAIVLTAASYAAHAGGIAGIWHVAVPVWGIEDHLLVIQEHDGLLTGRFEFVDVKGSSTDTGFQFDAVEPNGTLLLHFQGAAARGGTLEGTVTSPKNGLLVQHGVADPLSTAWTARREAHTH